MKKLKLSFVLSILFITACSSTPKQASADMTGINVSPVKQEYFESKHGCLDIINIHAKNEFKITGCWSLAPNSTKRRLKKMDDAIFVDVFNEYKESNSYLNNCMATDIIRLSDLSYVNYSVELIYRCEES